MLNSDELETVSECRLCSVFGPHRIDIWTEDLLADDEDAALKLRQKISECVGVKVALSDAITKICNECHGCIEKFSEFRRMCCDRNQQFLLRRVRSNTPATTTTTAIVSNEQSKSRKMQKAKRKSDVPLNNGKQRSNTTAMASTSQTHRTKHRKHSSREEPKQIGMKRKEIKTKHQRIANDGDLPIKSKKKKMEHEKKKTKTVPIIKKFVYSCLQCRGTDFDTLSGLHFHENNFHGDDGAISYQCFVCKKMLPTKSELKMHMNISHEIPKKYGKHLKQFRCVKCESAFIMKRDLLKHTQEAHPMRVIYRCPYETCSFTFPSRFKAGRHFKEKHVFGKRYECPVCQVKFYQLVNQKRHTRNVHGIFM